MSSKAPPRRIGILGGMGPAAAADLLSKVIALTPAEVDQDHVPVVLWNDTQVPPRIPAIRGEGPSPLPAMMEGVRFLEQAGCEALAIACNTAHHWAEEMEARMRIPLLHIADAAVAEIAGARTVALLGTRGTRSSGFYRRRLEARGLAVIEPGEAIQQAVDRTIALVKRNDLDAARASLSPLVHAMHDEGADAVVLACTELPLAAPREGAGLPLVDPTRALARAIVSFSLRSPCGP